MKHVQAILSASKDRESNFHHCGSPVKLVQSRLCAENTLQRRLNVRGGAMKHVQVCLGVSADQECSFYHCGGPVNIVQVCL